MFGIVAILSLTGVFTWFTINEQEDPFFPYRNGFINIVAPGMSAEAIETTIVRPLERSLNSIDELASLTTEVSDGVGSIDVKLLETTYDTEKAWQRIRDKVNDERASNSGVDIELQDRAQDTQGILLTINSTQSLLDTRQFALYLQDELYKLPVIRDISLVGDPGARIEVYYPQSLMLETSISPISIANQIAEANSMTDIGKINGDLFQTNIQPITRIDSPNSLGLIDIKSADGEVLKLAQLSEIKVKTNPNISNSFWVNGHQKIGLSIALPPNQTRVVDFGETLIAKINALNAVNPEYLIEPIFFQPKWTEERRSGLLKSLVLSSLAVGAVLFLLMSQKLALVVSIAIPAIAFTSLAFFGLGGGVLQQMSIAGMVISLGLMVDNSIVMAELIARYREAGMTPVAASQKAIKELYRPLATSTLTTIAAFVPMLISQGDVADFIRMVPVIVVTTISISYLFALIFIPTLTNNVNQFEAGRASNGFRKVGMKMGRLGTSRPKTVISLFCALLALSFLFGSESEDEFFPKSSRNQAFVDIQGDFGLSHDATLKTVRLVEKMLAENPQVQKYISFVGNSGPRFYYNMSEAPNQSNVARIVFTTHSNEDIPQLVDTLNQQFKEMFKSTRVYAREIGQGPPIGAPIEIRVLGDDRHILLAASEEIFGLLNEHPDTIDTRREYVVSKPKLSFQLNNNMQKSGLTRTDVSKMIAWRSSGLQASSIAVQRENLDIVIVDSQAEKSVDANYLMNTFFSTKDVGYIPISSFATHHYVGEEPTLTRQSGFNAKVISSNVRRGKDEDDILNTLMSRLRQIEQQYRVTLEFGGEAEEEEGSGGALVKVLPVGVILLFSAF